MKDVIRVLLADDHHMFIDGMKAVLQSNEEIRVVGQALNGEEVLTTLENQDVDVLVLDINMPKLNGVETAREVKEKYPNVKILVLTMHGEKEFIMNLMEIGAAGYVLKKKTTEELIMAIHNVHVGNSHYGLEVLNEIVYAKREKKDEVILTEREREVLCEIAEGYTSKEISARLEISVATVNTHRRNLLHKLDATNDKHLVRYAIKKGLVEL